MAFINVIFGANEPQTKIGTLQIDALLSEQNVLLSSATQYPVEDGSTISDHVTRQSVQLAVSGVVTSAGVSLFSPGGRTKLVRAKDALKRIHADRQPITIVTGMDVYSGYVMTTARIGRTNEGEKLTLDCSFLEIRKTQVEKAAIPTETVAPQLDGKDQPIPGAGARGRAGQTAAPLGTVSQADTITLDPGKLQKLEGML